MATTRRLPDFNQLSVLIATILLAYASLPYVSLPQRELSLPLPGIVFSLELNANTAIGLLVAGLSGSGTSWILSKHPKASNKTYYEHLIIPGLSALVIGLPLSAIAISPTWWVIFSAGGMILLLVIMAEYITLDPDDIRQPAAAGFLTAVAYAIFLLLVINIFAASTRLFILLPVVFVAAWLLALRVLKERTAGVWMVPQATAVALVTTQLAAAYHYLPISPLTAGLLSVGPAYALTQLAGNLSEDQPLTQAVVEPGIILIVIVGIAWWI